jgi:hypothetical protein
VPVRAFIAFTQAGRDTADVGCISALPRHYIDAR